MAIDPFVIGGTDAGRAGGTGPGNYDPVAANAGTHQDYLNSIDKINSMLGTTYITGMYGNQPVPVDALTQMQNAAAKYGGTSSLIGSAAAPSPKPSDTGGMGGQQTYAQPTYSGTASAPVDPWTPNINRAATNPDGSPLGTGGFDPMPGGKGAPKATEPNPAGSLIGSAAQNLYGQVLGRQGQDFETQYWQDYSKTHNAADTQAAFINAAQAELDARKKQNPGTVAPYSSGQYETGGVTNWNVTPNQTVAGQVASLIDPNSPLIQQAQAMAQQAFQARGLGNSSMATTAGQDAAYRTALPIAQQDASTHATAAQTNAGASNQLNLTGMQLNNSKDIANLQAQTQAMNNASAQYIAQQQNATTLTQTGMNNASALGITNANNLNAVTLAGLNNASAQTIASIQAAAQKYNVDTTTATNLILGREGNATTLANTQLGNTSAQQIARINQETSVNVANIQGSTQKEIQNLQNQYSNLTNTNSNAANLMNQASVNITNIQNNSAMDDKTKATAIANIQATLQSSLKVMQGISGLNLGDLYTQLMANSPGFNAKGELVGFNPDGTTKGTEATANGTQPPGPPPPPAPTPGPSDVIGAGG